MRVNTEALIRKIAEKYNISYTEAKETLYRVSDTISDLIDEGCTSFRIPKLFTLEFRKFKANVHHDIRSHELRLGRPRIKAQIILGENMKERVRRAFDVSPKIF